MYLYQGIQDNRQQSGIIFSKPEDRDKILLISTESEVNQVADNNGDGEIIQKIIRESKKIEKSNSSYRESQNMLAQVASV